ncbi:MAG: sensor histidine kinase, partial [Anaerolineae bacterium]
RSHIMVPICHRDHVLGLLRLDSHIPGKFTDDDAERLQPLTNAAAIALENARLYEQALQDAQTKLTLLNEVNHRVKNNLATIIGLLYAEQHHTGLETRPAYQTIFNNMINRVQGLATVHNLLSAVEWSPLSLADLTKQVTHSALQALPSDKQISVVVEPSPVQVTPKQASNLAMVINELATNSAKHALPQTDGRLQITARIALKEDHVHFEFRDNGPGYPPPVLKGDPDFLNVGFELIHNLVRRNMRGALSLYNEHGAVTVITFNKEVDAGYEA